MALGRGLAQAECPEGSFAVLAPGAPIGRLLGMIAAEQVWKAADV
jgi:hypothetical protein